MQTMTAKHARFHVRDLLDAAIAGHPVALTRYGKVVAVVFPASFLPTIGPADPADEKQPV